MGSRFLFILKGVGGLFFTSIIAFNAMAETITPIHLRTDPSVPLCTFDRTKAKSLRVTDKTITGSFAIQCRPDAKPYKMQTTLSPLASVVLDDDVRRSVRWYVRNGGPACRGDAVHPESVPLHSANISSELVGDYNNRVWSYCLQISPLDESNESPLGKWPLQGELALTLVDSKSGWYLPHGATRMMVRFANNSSDLLVETKQIIDTLMNNIGAPASYQVHLHAHTSLVGDADYNHDLSIMRLMRVREHLIGQHGIKRSKTWGQAWGESRPSALNTIDDEEEQNRRVDLILIPHNPINEVSVQPAQRVMSID